MHFRFDDEQLAMRDAVRSFCADRFALDAVASRERQPAAESAWSGLADLGILGMLALGDDAELGITEATLVFEELGAHLASGPVLWTTLAAELVEGAADGAVRVAGIDLSGPSPGPVVLDHGAEAAAVLVVHDDRVELCRPADLPDARAGSSMDPLTPCQVLSALPTGEVVADAAGVRRLRLRGRVLASAMLVGVAQGALDTARDYALGRQQFGVPIGSFQAIKHILADCYARVEMARAAAYAAAALTAGRGAGDPELAASTAKLLAGEAGLANSRAAVQVLGGMGFTWDMLPHLFLKRTWVLEEVFGTTSEHAARLGEAVGDEVAAS